MPSVLFVCTANQFRSPLAAALFKQAFLGGTVGEGWSLGSAGTWTQGGLPLPSLTLRVARSLGLEGLQDHRTRAVDPELLAAQHLIVVMEQNHKEAIRNEFTMPEGRVRLLSELAGGPPYDVPDPALPGVDPQDVGRELRTLVESAGERIIAIARSNSRA